MVLGAVAGVTVAVLLFSAGWYLKGRSVALEAAEKKAEVIRERERIEDDVENLEDDDLANRLSRGD